MFGRFSYPRSGLERADVNNRDLNHACRTAGVCAGFFVERHLIVRMGRCQSDEVVNAVSSGPRQDPVDSRGVRGFAQWSHKHLFACIRYDHPTAPGIWTEPSRRGDGVDVNLYTYDGIVQTTKKSASFQYGCVR